MESLNGHPGQSGAHMITTEVPYDKPTTVYERDGVTVSSFPVIHMMNGAVGYRLDYGGRSVVFSGDTRPCHTLVEACDGADLLVHETFPSAPVFARKAGVPIDFAEMVVNGVHTSPAMAGKVFERAGARMSAMWHLAVDHESVGPVYPEMRTQHDGPVVISQDLTVFDIAEDAVVARQRTVDPAAWPIVGPTTVQGPPESQPLPRPHGGPTRSSPTSDACSRPRGSALRRACGRPGRAPSGFRWSVALTGDPGGAGLPRSRTGHAVA